MGGTEGIDALVEAFYRRIEADTEMRPVYPEDLEPGKWKLKLFLGQWFGGPAEYSERFGHPRLRRRHFPFVIGEKHAGLWLKHMREAFHERDIPKDVEELVFPRFGELARHMVNEGEDVPREPMVETYMS